MKKINLITIIIVGFINQSLNAQCYGLAIVDILDRGNNFQTGYYHKDLYNKLNQFEGTYHYENNGEIFEIKLSKRIGASHRPNECEDEIVGGYKYINTNYNINVNYLNYDINNPPNGGKYILDFLSPFKNNTTLCYECDLDEYFLRGRISDTNKNSAKINIRKIIHNGVEALKVDIRQEMRWKGETEPDFLPILYPFNNEFILIKQ
jgi:hypothetical protein